MNSLVIDGDHLVFRHLFIPDKRLLRSSVNGMPTGIVFGVLSSMARFLDVFQRVNRCIVVLGGGTAKFRLNLLPSYKRRDVPSSDTDEFHSTQPGDFLSSAEMLNLQLPVLEDFLSCLNVRVGRLPGYEADDLAALCVRDLLDTTEDDIIVVSGDKDYLQTVAWSDRVSVFVPKDEMSVDREVFLSKFGFPPEQFIFYKALIGDPSDNIPNTVRGLGKKRALQLLVDSSEVLKAEEYFRYDEFLRWCKDSGNKYGTKVWENQESFQRNVELMDWNMIPWGSLEGKYANGLVHSGSFLHYNPERLLPKFLQLELRSVLNVLSDDNFKFLS